MKKIVIAVMAALLLVLMVVAAFFAVRIKQLNFRLSQSLAMVSALQSEADRLNQERQQLTEERNRLQTDTVSYMSMKTNLQAESRKAKEELEKAYLAMDNKEAELAKTTLALENLEKKFLKDVKEQKDTIIKEKGALIRQLHSLKAELNREKGLYYYNLGVTQAAASLYNDAMASYEKSLEFDPDNFDTYYNMGLLYEKIMRDFKKAVSCYRKYLELYPQAPDKNEIKKIIEEILLNKIKPS
jgi:tetratricopeptide (TPR) repeat protein